MISGLSGLSGLSALMFDGNTIEQGVVYSNSFVTSWKTDNAGTSNSNQITLPLVASGTYNFFVDWGDGTNSTITTWNQAETTHTYANGAGTYTVVMTPKSAFSKWSFADGGDKLKILTVSQWGKIRFVDESQQFFGCANLTSTATDAPDLSLCTTLALTFTGCTLFNGNIGSWNTSTVTSFASTFSQAIAFNQDIGSWNTAAATTMTQMFNNAQSFNQDIGSWNTAAVTTTEFMLLSCAAFNQDLGGWNITSLTNANRMFDGANALSTTNYDALLIGWEAQVEQPNVTFHAGDAQYSTGAAATARAALVSNGWVITDGGQVP